LVSLLPPKLTVCEEATVNPASKSANCEKVAVPVTVIVSPAASPRVTAPFAVKAPVISTLDEKVAALVTPNVPEILVLPSPAETKFICINS